MRLRAFMWQGVLTIFSSLGCTIALHIRVPFRKHNLRSACMTNQAPRPSVAQKRLLQLKTFWEDSGNSYCHYNKSDDCLRIKTKREIYAHLQMESLWLLTNLYVGAHYISSYLPYHGFHHNRDLQQWLLLSWVIFEEWTQSHWEWDINNGNIFYYRREYIHNNVHTHIAKFMGPTWVLSAPNGPHVGPMDLAIRVSTLKYMW